jgi:DNA (cytosine-5)-methyltransferase 1
VAVATSTPTSSAASDLEFLCSGTALDAPASRTELTVADLFSGCGGLSLGVLEGARRAGRSASMALAIDFEQAPLDVLRESLGDRVSTTTNADLGELRAVGSRRSSVERQLLSAAEGVDILVAGPPCQGHSALNNHTRHDDARNDLYLAVIRAAELLTPPVVIVENVRGIGRDKRRSVERSRRELSRMGYAVEEYRVDLSDVGAPQRRIRHVLVATERPFHWQTPKRVARTVAWAITDLLEVEGTTPYNTASIPSPDNLARMRWLLDNDEYDLPNPRRPRCHQSDHSYFSMYGRLRWNQPAQTITSGYGSMGQGRFVHPSRARTLTPHEAARLQFLPDFLQIGRDPRRGAWARMIGNAVPPVLTISLAQALLVQAVV